MAKHWWDACQQCGAESLGKTLSCPGPVYYQFMTGYRQILCEACAADRFLLCQLDLTVNGEEK